MNSINEEIENFVVDLYQINAVKFGEFKLKTGIMSPIYFDLRVIVSYPKLMKKLSTLLVQTITKANLKPNHICGVPYTALPIASLVSVDTDISMLVRRKEAKDHGTRKMVEGRFSNGDSCIIIEDVISSGSSILETVKDLEQEGLKTTDAVVVLDRNQGARENLISNGVNVHVLVTLYQLLGILVKRGLITNEVSASVRKFVEGSQINTDGSLKNTVSLPKKSRVNLTFSERANLSEHPVAKRILKIMEEKQTLLAIAADVDNSADLLSLAEAVGPYIVVFKTHADVVLDFSKDVGRQLMALAQKFNFVILEDRKYADIGNTVCLQFEAVKEFAELVTVHSVPGPSVITGLRKSSSGLSRGAFLVAELSCEGALTNSQYAKETARIAENNKDFVVGLVCQSPTLISDPTLIQLTPGIQMGATGDGLGQQYCDPWKAVVEKGCDLAVVGRGILKANDRAKAAKEYKEALWKAYCARVSGN